MALDIRPPAANTTNKSSAVSSKQSAKAASPGADLFATHLAQSAKSSSKQTSAPKQQSASKPQRDKSPSASDKQDGNTKAAAADGSNKSGAADSKASKASSTKANAQSGKNGSASAASDTPAPDAANAADESSAAGSPSTNATSKGRGPARGAAAKSSAPQAAAPAGQATAADADPTTDASNSSGLSLLQLLAQASKGEDSSAPATDATADTGSDQSTQDEDGSQPDPNALTLAMLSQAFAAGFAPPAAAQTAAAAQDTSSNATADATNTAGAIDANGRSSGGSAQQLVTLLVRDLTAQAQGKTDSDAPRSAVAATKEPAEAAGSTNSSAPTAESAAQSLAQLGAASHFSRETNLTELKAPLGSPAWNDELGGHLTWMTHRGLESGSLKVSPEHLGPVEVQITVQNGDASVWFGASHPDTRAALEQALPRLRELFANQGLTLTDSGVSREPPRNQTRSTAPHNSSVSAISGTSEVSAASSARVSLGLIDTYA